MSSPINTHKNHSRNSIFENDAQKRGFIIVIILCILATVGMFCLIISLVVCKNKRDRRKRAAKMNAGINLPGAKGKYRKLEDEEEGGDGGVWSVEMDDRRPTAYKDGQYAQACEERKENEGMRWEVETNGYIRLMLMYRIRRPHIDDFATSCER
jgi:hypothetical protein